MKINKPLLFSKGLLMGICDLMPGVSGGTIAFVTGIYEQLLTAVKEFDFKFLGVLGLGIACAVIGGSYIVRAALDHYFVYVMSFFVGMIMASSKVIYKGIKHHSIINSHFGIVGLLLGLSLMILVPNNIPITPINLIVIGFIAITAMFLPGISGAFILLMFGFYDTLLDMLHNVLANWSSLAFFCFGCLLGAFLIPRYISFYLGKYRSRTLYVLLGLVLGSLVVILFDILDSLIEFGGSVLLIFVALIVGVLVVQCIEGLKQDKGGLVGKIQ